MRFNRIFLIVLDSLGVGEAQDADRFNDKGCNTLGHIHEKCNLFIPNLKKLGFLNTINMSDFPDTEAYYTIAKPNNDGKDTLSGHYEMMGLPLEKGFKTYPNGFPIPLLQEIATKTSRSIIGNKSISGVKIIEELGSRHMETGSLIIYTSSDSTLQVAAHEDIIPVNKLYEYCEIIRKITLREDIRIGRVIARPFTGKPGNFKRINALRHDYSVKPYKRSVLNEIKDSGLQVISIGKINDIFDGEGITKVIKAPSNIEGLNKLLEIMEKNFTGLCFANLNDFDTLYGHRRDVEGYAKAIEDLDINIPIMLNKLNSDDLLIITADHGNDPTFEGSDHTRENVPVIIYSRSFIEPKKLPIMETFADIGATISENFKVGEPSIGKSFLDKLK